MLTKMLERLGFLVSAVSDGKEVIEKYRESLEKNEPYSAIIMDLTIPGGMGGKEAVKEIHKLDVNAKVIVSSGYSSEASIAEYQALGFIDVLEKPYTLSRLKEVIAKV